VLVQLARQEGGFLAIRDDSVVHLIWIIGSACALNLGVILFLGHLIAFHLKLQRIGLTTFEYIKLSENKQRESKIVKRIREISPPIKTVH